VVTIEQLRTAIDYGARADSPLELYLPPNTTLRLGGAAINVGPISVHLASDGEGATLDAGGDTRAFELQPLANLTLTSLTLANGRLSGGGGTLAVASDILVRGSHVSFVNSSCGANGGAILTMGGTVELNDCVFRNSSSQSFGGVITVAGGRVTLYRTLLVQSATQMRDGGVIYLTSGILTIKGCSIEHSQSARYGGAIHVLDGTVSAANCSFVNTTSLDMGGSIGLSSGQVSLSNCAFVNTYAHRDGGAFRVSSGRMIITGGSIRNASSRGNGGAISNTGWNERDLNQPRAQLLWVLLHAEHIFAICSACWLCLHAERVERALATATLLCQTGAKLSMLTRRSAAASI
jgi:hypothetical protein